MYAEFSPENVKSECRVSALTQPFTQIAGKQSDYRAKEYGYNETTMPSSMYSSPETTAEGVRFWPAVAERCHSPSLTLALEEGEDVVRPHGALDVTNDRPAGVVKELYPDLGDTTTRAGTAEDLRARRRSSAQDHHLFVSL